MFIIIIVLVVAVVVLDFVRMKKENLKKSAIYLSIVTMSAIIYAVHKIEIFNTSPLEIFIKKMEPLILWLEKALK